MRHTEFGECAAWGVFCVWILVSETQFRSPGSRRYPPGRVRSAPLRSVGDVKAAWRSRWLRHRSMRSFCVFNLNCLRVFCWFSHAGLARTRMPRGGVSEAGSCEAVASPGLAAARVAFEQSTASHLPGWSNLLSDYRCTAWYRQKLRVKIVVSARRFVEIDLNWCPS